MHEACMMIISYGVSVCVADMSYTEQFGVGQSSMSETWCVPLVYSSK